MVRALVFSLVLALAAGLPCGAPAQAPAASPAPSDPPPDGPRVLRYAFPIAETGFDPAQLSDLYSRTVTAGIFEAPLTFDFLARPFRMKPLTAQALPLIEDDFRSFTVRLQP